MTTDENRELIAELRKAAERGREGTHTASSAILRGADLASRAADALEGTLPEVEWEIGAASPPVRDS